MSKLQKLTRERNFAKMQLAGVYQHLTSLMHSNVLTIQERKSCGDARAYLFKTLHFWDDKGIILRREWRKNHG